MILLLLAALLGSQGGRYPNATAFTSPATTVLRSQSINLSRELAAAQRAWGVELSNVSIQWEDIGPCRPVGFHVSLKALPPENLSADQHPEWVTTQLNLDGVKLDLSQVVRWVIRINSSCDWGRLPVQETVQHELGHILGLPHTLDRHDIMYPVPARGQRISRADREAVR